MHKADKNIYTSALCDSKRPAIMTEWELNNVLILTFIYIYIPEGPEKGACRNMSKIQIYIHLTEWWETLSSTVGIDSKQ